MIAGHTKSSRLAAVLVGLALTSGAGCVEKSRHVSKTDQDMIEQIVSKQAPKPQHSVDFRFETKVRLIGYDLSASRATPGRPLKITWYWQVDQSLGDGWKLFTHLADDKRKNRLNMDANRLVRDVYPAHEWKAGEYITDVQEMTLPKDWGADRVLVYQGFWNGPHRLHVTKGEHDSDNRALVLTLPVGEAGEDGEASDLPTLEALRIDGPIRIDGKLTEKSWQRAARTTPFVHTLTGAPGAFKVTAQVLYDPSHLFVAMEVQDDFLRSEFTKHDQHLWEQDTVEMMLDPDGDGANYFELQVSPRGVVFDTRYDTRRRPQPFGDVAWNSELEAGVQVDGEIDDDAADRGYTVEFAIPWAAFSAGAKPAVPPAEDTRWRVNFYVLDAQEKGQRAVGWSPPKLGDFHVPARFGYLHFPEAAVAPVAPDQSATAESPAPGGGKQGQPPSAPTRPQ